MNKDLEKILTVSAGETFAYDTTKTWLDLFKEQVAKTPGNIAVADENSAFSYKALDELSDKVAVISVLFTHIFIFSPANAFTEKQITAITDKIDILNINIYITLYKHSFVFLRERRQLSYFRVYLW